MSHETVIYRPPREAMTPLLPVTVGCSHNRCSFCNMYRGIPFRRYPREQIRRDLAEIRLYRPQADRIYLVGGDPFVLSADHLNDIIDDIQAVLPGVSTVTMYASVSNIARKTDAELRQLRARGINQLYIGLETGSDALLKRLCKGSGAEDAVRQLNRLTEAGMTYGVIIMTGIAGRGACVQNAIETAQLMNRIRARVLYCNSLVVMPDTPLGADRDAGRFEEAGEYERLEELLALFEHLSPQSRLLVNSYHVSNALNINAEVPDDQTVTIERIRSYLQATTPEEMERRFSRQNMRI